MNDSQAMDAETLVEPFEFEVAGVADLAGYGILVYGWYRSGSVRPGELVAVSRYGDRLTKVSGYGFLCKGPPGSPDGQLLLDDQGLAAELIAGDRIRVRTSA